MKLLISLFVLTFSVITKAAFITIYHQDNYSEATKLQNVFLEKYEIPHNWIGIKGLDNSRCHYDKKSEILDLCLNDKGELIELSRNQKQINALKILRKRGVK